MALEVEVKENLKTNYKPNTKNRLGNSKYSVFSEQYLEKQVIKGNYKLGLSVTCCTFRGIPLIDDF